MKKENGLSIAQCEYWSDTLDRWAEDLVDPASGGTCKAKSKSSLPPALVLEALQILEGEVNLREETRVAEQAKPALLGRRSQAAGRQALGDAKGPERSGRHARREDPRTARRRERVCLRDRPAGQGLGGDGRGDHDPGSARDRRPGDRRRDRGHRAAACSRSESIPRGAAAAARPPAAAATARRSTRPWPCSAAESTTRKFAKTAASLRSTGDSGPSLPEEFRAGLDEYFNRLSK